MSTQQPIRLMCPHRGSQWKASCGGVAHVMRWSVSGLRLSALSGPLGRCRLKFGGDSSGRSPLSPAGIPASSGNSLDSLHDDNPPHWLKSLQALTEMDAPGPAPGSAPATHIAPPLHRPGWAPYPHAPPLPPGPASQYHSPPPGFHAPPPTDLLQSAAMERH